MNTLLLKPARIALTLFLLSALVSLLTLTGLSQYRERKEISIALTQQKLTATANDINTLTFDLDSIRRLQEKYQRLTRLGFTGEADRDGWVQRLDALYRDTKLPPTLRYTLAPPEYVKPDASDYLKDVQQHDLNIELSGIHEGEFIAFLDSLSIHWRAPYRVDSCRISRGAETGLEIKCTLRLYSLQAGGKAS